MGIDSTQYAIDSEAVRLAGAGLDVTAIAERLVEQFPKEHHRERIANTIITLTHAGRKGSRYPAYITTTKTVRAIGSAGSVDEYEQDTGRFYQRDRKRRDILDQKQGLQSTDWLAVDEEGHSTPITEISECNHIYHSDTRKYDNKIFRDLISEIPQAAFEKYMDACGLKGEHRRVFFLWAYRNIKPSEITRRLKKKNRSTVHRQLDTAMEKVLFYWVVNGSPLESWGLTEETFGIDGLLSLYDWYAEKRAKKTPKSMQQLKHSHTTKVAGRHKTTSICASIRKLKRYSV